MLIIKCNLISKIFHKSNWLIQTIKNQLNFKMWHRKGLIINKLIILFKMHNLILKTNNSIMFRNSLCQLPIKIIKFSNQDRFNNLDKFNRLDNSLFNNQCSQDKYSSKDIYKNKFNSQNKSYCKNNKYQDKSSNKDQFSNKDQHNNS